MGNLQFPTQLAGTLCRASGQNLAAHGHTSFAYRSLWNSAQLDPVEDDAGDGLSTFTCRPALNIPEATTFSVDGANKSNPRPPVAILACSRGGRLVASGITVTVDQRGRCNVKAARVAAKEATRLATMGKEQVHEDIRKHNFRRTPSTGAGHRRRRCDRGVVKTGGEGGGHKERGGASSWALTRDNRFNATSTEQPKHSAYSARVRTGASVSTKQQHQRGDSVAPSSFVFSSGSCTSAGGGSIGETEGSTLGALAGDTVQETRKTRGIDGDSVAWISSRRTSRPTPSFRARRGDGPGQGETIRRLVHMGLF